MVNDQRFEHNSNYVIDSVHAFISYGRVWVFLNTHYVNRRYDENEKQLFLMVCIPFKSELMIASQQIGREIGKIFSRSYLAVITIPSTIGNTN